MKNYNNINRYNFLYKYNEINIPLMFSNKKRNNNDFFINNNIIKVCNLENRMKLKNII